MPRDTVTEESFLEDVAGHQFDIRRDDGLYRHLRFSHPKTSNMWFDIVTWPGMLCYHGDMGSYLFRRCPDMLEFFRHPKEGGPLYVNPGYWAEKVEAIDRDRPIEEFIPDKFRERIADWLDEAEASPKIRKAVEREVLSRADDGEHEAMRAACEFEHDGFRFADFWEVNVKDYSYRFIWCCYAIAWAVRQYDAAHAEAQTTGA